MGVSDQATGDGTDTKGDDLAYWRRRKEAAWEQQKDALQRLAGIEVTNRSILDCLLRIETVLTRMAGRGLIPPQVPRYEGLHEALPAPPLGCQCEYCKART